MAALAISAELHNALCIISLMLLIILLAFWLLNQARDTYVHYQAAKNLQQQSLNENDNRNNNNNQRQNILLLSSRDVRDLRDILTNIHANITIDPRQIRQILKQSLGSSVVRDVQKSVPDLHRDDNGFKFSFDYCLPKYITLLNSKHPSMNENKENDNDNDNDNDEKKNNEAESDDDDDIDDDALSYNKLKNSNDKKGSKFTTQLVDEVNEPNDIKSKYREDVLENAKNRKKKGKENVFDGAKGGGQKNFVKKPEKKSGVLCMEFYFGVSTLYFEELVSLIDFNEAKQNGNVLSSKELRKAHRQTLSKKVSVLGDKIHDKTSNTKERFKRISSVSFRRNSAQVPLAPNTPGDEENKNDGPMTEMGMLSSQADAVHSDNEYDIDDDQTDHESSQERNDEDGDDDGDDISPGVTPDPLAGDNVEEDNNNNNDNTGNDNGKNENQLKTSKKKKNRGKKNKKKKNKKKKKKKQIRDELTMDKLRPFSHFHSLFQECELGSDTTFDHSLLESTVSAILSGVIKNQQKAAGNDQNKSKNDNKEDDNPSEESYFFCVLISYVKYERSAMDIENASLVNDNILNSARKNKNHIIDENYEISHLEISFFEPPTALTRDNTVAGSSGANITRNPVSRNASFRGRASQRARGNMSSAMNPAMSMQILVDFPMQQMVQYMDIFGLNSYKSTLEEDNDDADCKICFSAPRSVVLLPCRHCCVCKNCFTQIHKCPMCRKEIKNSLRWANA